MNAASKPWWQSKTILGALAVLLAAGASAAGIDLDEGTVTETLERVVTAAGAVLAIIGRITARAPIGGER